MQRALSLPLPRPVSFARPRLAPGTFTEGLLWFLLLILGGVPESILLLTIRHQHNWIGVHAITFCVHTHFSLLLGHTPDFIIATAELFIVFGQTDLIISF